MLGGAGGCERRASDVSSAAAPRAFATSSSSRVHRRPARVRGIVVIAHARASHLELGHWLGGLGWCAQGWGELLYMCFYLRVRHAACGTGKSRWNVVVCVESSVRLWGAAFRFWNVVVPGQFSSYLGSRGEKRPDVTEGKVAVAGRALTAQGTNRSAPA